MTLTMRIENFDYLPDGGPLDVTVNQRGFEAGRDSMMEWTLPDGTRHISGRHFEVVWRDGGYWLTDLSTNGTFLYGQSMRISSPYQLHNNDRLQIGQYIIRVLIEAQPAASPAPAAGAWPAASPSPTPVPTPQPAPAPQAAPDPWDLGGGSPQPAPLPKPNTPANPMPGGNFGDSFISAPQPTPVPQPVPAPQPTPVPQATPVPQPTPVPRPAAPSEGFPAARPPQPARPVAPAPAQGGVGAALLEAICRGANLPPGSLNGVDPNMLGEEIGRSLRITTTELMALLSARAAAKQMVKSGSRTMVAGMNNSPLKFKPNAAEAMNTMFVQRSDSYLSATDSLQQGFDDIKGHQTAVYAAIQPALARLLEDLSPEAISKKTSGGLVGGKKSRLWDTFVERWDAKTHPHENGMLDVFLAYFAEAYDEAIRKTGK